MKNYLAACLHCAAKFFINLVIFGENLAKSLAFGLFRHDFHIPDETNTAY